MENTQLTLLPLSTLSACVVSIAFCNWTMRACQSHVYGYDHPIFYRSQYLSSVVRPPRNYPAWSCHGGTPPFDPLQLRIRLWHLPLFLAVFLCCTIAVNCYLLLYSTRWSPALLNLYRVRALFDQEEQTVLEQRSVRLHVNDPSGPDRDYGLCKAAAAKGAHRAVGTAAQSETDIG